MDNKDSFRTIGHLGGFIHVCSNRTTGLSEVQVQFFEGDRAKPAKSIHAAKCRITRYLNQTGDRNAKSL